MFKSWLDKQEPVYTNAGDPIRKLYKPELTKNGDIELVEDGFENLYDEIQSYADSVDINVIVSRYAHGDAYALQQRSGMYGDFINVPHSYMEVLNAAIDLKRIYSENKELQEKYATLEDFVNNYEPVAVDTTIPKIDIESEGDDSES